MGSSGKDEAGEFSRAAVEPPDALARRTFLKLMGASAALAGLGGCHRRADKIVPYARRPPEVTPGAASHYATSMMLDGYATGLIVESHEGRPTKVEGNPDHPASLGASGVHEQAWVLGLYDPCRATTLRRGRDAATWGSLVRALGPARERGREVHIILEPTSSPTVASLLARIARERPDCVIHFHAPLASDGALEATRALLGRPLTRQLDLTMAARVVALDSDLLAQGPFHLRYARDFALRRRPSPDMNRLYAVEPRLTPTGSSADHRLARRASEVERIAGALLAEVVTLAGERAGVPAEMRAALERLRASGDDAPFVKACARDLVAHAGDCAIVAGSRQPASVHALSILLNRVLHNFDHTMWYTEPALIDAGGASHGLERLVGAIDRKTVQALAILGGNPVYTAPADLELARRLADVPETVSLALHEHETARRCGWFVPEAHGLESWGDGRAHDGTLTLAQPLVNPLHNGKTAIELLAALLPGGAERSSLDLVRETFHEARGAGEDEWRRALERGFAGNASPRVEPTVSWEAARSFVASAASAPRAPDGLEVVFVEDAAVHDGRFANNPWLLELPDPITKLTWDKAALVSSNTAAVLGLKSEDVVEIVRHGRSLEVPVLVVPGHADDALTLPLGYGRQGRELVAAGVGANAYTVRTTDASYFVTGFSWRSIGQKRRLAITQGHSDVEGRRVLWQTTLGALARGSTENKPEPTPRGALYEPPTNAGPQWAMTIDLNLCNGCNACVTACQAENNVPVVGKQGVLDGREMHWLRIDRYYSSEPEPGVVFEPMLCQHCEKAPCEYVCPVNATTHSPDGINEQTYNRCVGTRFCSNNCPYKVRRFNWFNYQAEKPGSLKLAMNPDVTVRERGVMEKCTFCVQRVREAEIRARVENRPLRDRDVKTACQQACPSRAIVFGSIADPQSEVTRSRADPRRFGVLEELGTRPRVQYLARVKNPNPELAP